MKGNYRRQKKILVPGVEKREKKNLGGGGGEGQTIRPRMGKDIWDGEKKSPPGHLARRPREPWVFVLGGKKGRGRKRRRTAAPCGEEKKEGLFLLQADQKAPFMPRGKG